MKRKSTQESVEPNYCCSSNDGIKWLRGPVIGKGSCGSVFTASLKPFHSKFSFFPPVVAVKSPKVSDSATLQIEKQSYDNLRGCDSLIKCFGEEITTDHNGSMIYNLLLQFAAGGTLADRINNTGGRGLPEREVRSYTRSIIRGLIHIHDFDYVHCDLEPANILLMPRNNRFIAKIADLGSARRAGKPITHGRCLGETTLMYMAPETLIHGVRESPSDIWALGCLVLEMLTGNRPWVGADRDEITKQIIEEGGIPKIPQWVSEEAKGFLKSCFVRSSEFRFTAEMLMFMPFMAAGEEAAPTYIQRQKLGPVQTV